jgi:hypothetical protein
MKRIAASQRGDHEIAAVWQAKQEGEPGGVVLPSSFPSYAAITPVGYVAQGDLDGADTDELYLTVGLSQREAEAVLAAFAKL